MTKEGAKDLEETLATSQELGEDHVDHGEGDRGSPGANRVDETST